MTSLDPEHEPGEPEPACKDLDQADQSKEELGEDAICGFAAGLDRDSLAGLLLEVVSLCRVACPVQHLSLAYRWPV